MTIKLVQRPCNCIHKLGSDLVFLQYIEGWASFAQLLPMEHYTLIAEEVVFDLHEVWNSLSEVLIDRAGKCALSAYRIIWVDVF